MISSVGRGIAVAVLALVVLGATLWAGLATYYSDLPSPRIRMALAVLFCAGTLVAFVMRPTRGTLVGFSVGFAAVVVWWLGIAPSNSRDWQPDVAVLAHATIDGDRITLHDIRDFEYRSETDFTPRYAERTFDLRELDSADLVASYWMGDAIAHVFVSFGFAGRDFLAISVETRKERGEAYSTLAGFFKQYELIYVVGDERDLIGVRTNHRRPEEDVYVYRAHIPRENVRRLFMDYVREINSLYERPQFYNTLTTNCTTGVLLHTRVNPGSPPYSWKVLLSGYAPQYAYELGRLDSSVPFDELRRRSRVNDRAHGHDRDAHFSQLIRP